jgi:hypothetical protein
LLPRLERRIVHPRLDGPEQTHAVCVCGCLCEKNPVVVVQARSMGGVREYCCNRLGCFMHVHVTGRQASCSTDGQGSRPLSSTGLIIMIIMLQPVHQWFPLQA